MPRQWQTIVNFFRIKMSPEQWTNQAGQLSGDRILWSISIKLSWSVNLHEKTKCFFMSTWKNKHWELHSEKSQCLFQIMWNEIYIWRGKTQKTETERGNQYPQNIYWKAPPMKNNKDNCISDSKGWGNQ